MLDFYQLRFKLEPWLVWPVDWSMSSALKVHRFDSPAGHKPRLRVQSPVVVRARGN